MLINIVVIIIQVRSSTLDTMRQMENQMLQHMKTKCPEAAEVMDSLVSGTEGKDMTMEKKEAFAEQVSLWQGGKPVEEKLNRETRYRSNDPISGPQDFIERSSVSRGGNEMQDRPFFNPYTPVKTDARVHNQRQARETHYAASRGDGYRDPRDRYYSGDDRTSSVFYPSGNSSPVRQDDARAEPYGFSGHQRADYSRQQQFQRDDFGRERMARDERPRAPEERSETIDKIIIPTKYRQANVDNSGSSTMSVPRSDMSMRLDSSRSAVSERSTVGQRFGMDRDRNYVRESDYRKGGEGGGLSEFAAFVSKEMDPSAFDDFDAIDGRLGYVRPESEKASKKRMTSQGEIPVEIRRLGSLHDEGPSGEWEFDMAVREIPRR